jgi:hypothetical protein
MFIPIPRKCGQYCPHLNKIIHIFWVDLNVHTNTVHIFWVDSNVHTNTVHIFWIDSNVHINTVQILLFSISTKITQN